MLKIVDIAVYQPDKVITINDLEKEKPEWDWHKIKNAIGVQKITKAADDEYAVDMGAKAANLLFQKTSINKNDIDFLFFISLNNHFIIPSPAFELARIIGLKGNVGINYNNLGCSGFLNVLMLIQGLFATNQAKRVLVVTSTNVRKYLHPNSQGTFLLFSDIATALIIDKDETKKPMPFVYGSNANFLSDIIIKDGAERHLYSESSYKQKTDKYGTAYSDATLYMNSVNTFNATISKTRMMLNELNSKYDVDLDKIDNFIFHQSSLLTLTFLQKKFNIPKEKMINSIEKYGNTIESSIPITIQEGLKEKKLKRGNKILLSVFGIGYSWISTVMEF